MKKFNAITQQICSLLRKAGALSLSLILSFMPLTGLLRELAPSRSSGVAAAESFPASAALKIVAVNPGYDLYNAIGEKITNYGEMVMLQNMAFSDVEELALDGFSLYYRGASGDAVLLYNFPGKSFMRGEKILLRYYKSELNAVDGILPSGLADEAEIDLEYSEKPLGITSGELTLLYAGEVVDNVCWGFSECSTRFYATSPTVLSRDIETGEFEHVGVGDFIERNGGFNGGGYVAPKVDEETGDNVGLGGANGEQTGGENMADNKTEENLEVVEPKCRGMRFNEILSYFTENRSETFVELYNTSSKKIELDGCSIRYKKKKYALAGAVVTGGFYVHIAEEMQLTKNPTTENMLELVDANEEVIDTLYYPHGQKKGASYANFSEDGADWRITYSPTPGENNMYQEFQSCPEGKVINPATGFCKKVEVTATTKTCPAGKYLNPETGRCKKYDTGTTIKPCKEGYERNPETNRCRKIRENTGAAYPVEESETEETTTFIAGGAVASLVAGGVGYTAFQFRKDLLKPLKKLTKMRPGTK